MKTIDAVATMSEYVLCSRVSYFVFPLWLLGLIPFVLALVRNLHHAALSSVLPMKATSGSTTIVCPTVSGAKIFCRRRATRSQRQRCQTANIGRAVCVCWIFSSLLHARLEK